MISKIRSIIFEGKFSLPIKAINIVSYYLIPIFIVLSLIFAYIVDGDVYFTAKDYGETAMSLLIVILFIKPLAQIFSRIKIFSKFLIIRRQLGVIMFWTILAHGVGTASSIGFPQVWDTISTYTYQSYLFWGVLAGVIVFFLGITSNMRAVKLLKRNWKRLHFLVYFAFFFTVLHIYFIAGEIGPIIVFIIYCILKFLAWKGVKI